MIEINITPSEMKFIRRFGGDAEIGGKSAVRKNINDRKGSLSEDQLIGQLAEAALHKYWYGHLLEYSRSRWFRNQVPNIGDGGIDIPPLNIDVKGSKIRDDNKPIISYNLLVRQYEWQM